jgi:hypothetical protein
VRITQWERTNIEPRVNPLIRSLHNAHDEPIVDCSILPPTQKIRKGGVAVAEAAANTIVMKSPMHVADEYHSDSDQKDEGL